MKSALARNREQYTRQMDTLTVEFTTRLRTLCEGFVRPDRLHAFERELVLLTLGEGRYEDAISGVEKVRKKIVDVGKENTRKVARATALRGCHLRSGESAQEDRGCGQGEHAQGRPGDGATRMPSPEWRKCARRSWMWARRTRARSPGRRRYEDAISGVEKVRKKIVDVGKENT